MTLNRKTIFLFLFFISGACGLIYEIVWSRLLVFVFGGTTFAITTILTCFMGGLALGSFIAGHYNKSIKNPGLIYGILELCVGLFSLIVPFLLDLAIPAYRMIINLTGESFIILTISKVMVSITILIIPTTCMGATLPILAKDFVKQREKIGSNIGKLYGFNTIGAVLGCVGAGFFLLPRLGLQGSIWLAASLNIIAGMIAVLLSKTDNILEKSISVKMERPEKKNREKYSQYKISINNYLLLILYGLSGFSAMAFQVSWTRTLILSFGSSTYAFSTIVTCFIFGLAAGSFIISIWIDKIKNPLGIAGILEAVIGLSALIIVPMFGEMPEIVRRISELQGANFANVLFIEILYVFCLLILPTICMGALMPLICRIYNTRSNLPGKSVGNVYAANTAGTIIGAFVTGFILIPNKSIGMQNTIIIVSALCIAIGTILILNEKKWRRSIVIIIVSIFWILGIAIGNGVKPWSKKIMVSGPFLGIEKEDYDVLYYREGIDATVAVTSPKGAKGILRALRINGKPDASNEWGDMITQNLLAHIPLLLKPESKEICVIGLGSGVTTGSALAYPVDKVDIVEISAAVIEAANFFNNSNNHALRDPRVNMYVTDARNFLLLKENKYDLIISEPSNPWMSGVANLYTKEFFEIVCNSLNQGGLHCQWIHSYSMKSDDFAAILRTMSEVFKYVQLWELMSTDFLILGSDEQISIDVESMYLSFLREPVSEILTYININDPMQMANYYVADIEHMIPWIDDKKILNDNFPYLEFSAPLYILKNEHNDIIKELQNIDGLPVVSSHSNSILNEKFLNQVEKSRNRRKYLYKANISASKRNLEETFMNFIQAGRCGSSDARIGLSLISELMAYGAVINSKKGQRLVNNTFKILSQIIPDFYQFQNIIYGNQARFYWPFSKEVRNDFSTDIQSIIEEIKILNSTGNKMQALQKGKKELERIQYNPSILTLMGELSSELEDSQNTIPYLLQALIMIPENIEVNYSLARAYSDIGNYKKTFYFLNAVKDEGFKDYKKILSDPVFDSLKGKDQFDQVINKMKE
jgi:spermidine synthase